MVGSLVSTKFCADETGEDRPPDPLFTDQRMMAGSSGYVLDRTTALVGVSF
jgi:hypothetical protein